MPPNKPHHYPPHVPLWRAFRHPTEHRWWRCRPTLAGIEIGSRDDGTAEWSQRLLDQAAVPPRPLAGERDYREREDARDRRLGEMLARANALVAEQLTAGFVEESPDPGLQVWDALRDLWRVRAPEVDISPLVADDADVGRWLLGAVAFVKHSNVTSPLYSKSSPGWWPPLTGVAHGEALDALRAHANRAAGGALLGLALPLHATVYRDTLLAASPLPDENLVFEALCAMLRPPRNVLVQPSLIWHLCAESRERAERVQQALERETAAELARASER
jgi:hypothetical protein